MLDASSAGCPPAAVRHGRARQSSGMDRVGIVEGSCGYQAHGFSIRGKFVFVEKPGVQDYKGCHVAQRSSDPRVAYPEVKVASCVQRGVSIRGKFVLSSHRS